MENEPVVHVGSKPKTPHHSRYSLKHKLLVAVVGLIVVALGLILILKFTATTNNSNTEKVLTIADLNKPDAKINSETPDASVENLTNELQTKIDKQIADKENPFETVNQLAGVLANTTNKTRQDQLTGFLEDFLAKHEDTLQFENESEKPDQAQVNYWKAKLYAKLVYNHQFIMLNKFTDSNGTLIDTTKEQLKYIDLYLALAKDPESHSRATEEYKQAPVGYAYSEAEDLLMLRDKLAGEEGQND